MIRRRLAELHGNGVICPCIWCGCLVADRPGRLHVGGRYLPIRKLEMDRLMPGGPYSLWNLVPACPDCNKRRTYTDQELPEGCTFGGWGPRRDEAS